MAPRDLSRYLGLFVQETTEHLEAYGVELLGLEEEGFGASRLEELFRLAHSIKGSAAAMQLPSITELAHHLEELFIHIRGATGTPERATLDLLAAVGRRLEEMVAAASTGAKGPGPGDLLDRLAELIAPPQDAPLRGEPRPSGESPPLQTGDRRGATRIRTSTLDELLDEAGEAVLTVARLRELERSTDEESKARELAALQRQVKGLHAKVLTARLTPISLVADRLEQLARGIARSTGKEVELAVIGGETELDRALLDGLVDPLGHLLRNCIHHGIETPDERRLAAKAGRGLVRLRIRRAGDRVELEMEDDGRGIDLERLGREAVARGLIQAEALGSMSRAQALLLCCLPGLSTAASVTEVSGRGVGMDAAARQIERLGGTLSIDSDPGRGTRFSFSLPLGVSVAPMLLIGVDEEIFAIPVAQVVAAVMEDATTRAALELAGDPTRRFHLSALMDPTAEPERRFPMFGQPRPCVIVQAGYEQVALHVDRLVGYEELVIKPLAPPLDRVAGIAGATLLASGRPVFLLDVRRLLDAAGVAERPRLR